MAKGTRHNTWSSDGRGLDQAHAWRIRADAAANTQPADAADDDVVEVHPFPSPRTDLPAAALLACPQRLHDLEGDSEIVEQGEQLGDS